MLAVLRHLTISLCVLCALMLSIMIGCDADPISASSARTVTSNENTADDVRDTMPLTLVEEGDESDHSDSAGEGDDGNPENEDADSDSLPQGDVDEEFLSAETRQLIDAVKFSVSSPNSPAGSMVEGSSPLRVSCTALREDGGELPEATYAWYFDGVEEAGPVSSHASRTHVFKTVGPHTVALMLTLTGATIPMSCTCAETGRKVVAVRVVEDLEENFTSNGSVEINGNGGGGGSGGGSGAGPASCTNNSDCNDGNPCTDDKCGAGGVCVYTADDSNSCDDGLYCNGTESCTSGTCVSSGDPCGSGEACVESADECRTGYTISGKITDYSGANYANVSVTFTGTGDFAGSDFVATTAVAGTYTQEVPLGWSGTVSSGSNIRFVPATRSYDDLSANKSNQNFSAFRNYYVATDGSDAGDAGTIQYPFATLNKAFGQLRAGDTVYLREGTYIGNDSGFGRLAPAASGRPDAHITVRNYPGEEVVIDRDYPGSSWTFIEFSKENAYWDFRGLEIVNFRVAFDLKVGSGFTGAPHNITFEQMEVHHCGSYGVAGEDGKAWRLRGAYDITIRNCQMHHIAGPGVNANYDTHDLLVEDCDSHDNDDGRGIDGDADGFNVDDYLTGEGASANSWPYNITFRRCRVWDCTEDGIDIKADNVLVEQCEVRNVGANAYKLWAISDSKAASPAGVKQTTYTVRNCFGYNPGESCIEAIHEPDVILLNNTFVSLDGADETFVIPRVKNYDTWIGKVYARNNIFLHYGNSGGQARAMLVDTFGWDLDLDYNVCFVPFDAGHTILRRIDGASGHYYSDADIEDGTFFGAEGLEEHGRGALPAFADSGSGDFHLDNADTTARNRGIAVDGLGVTVDLEGTSRPLGGAFDRGCYEHP